jgi:hypothetical protein
MERSLEEWGVSMQYRLGAAINVRQATLVCLVTWLVATIPICVVTYPPLWDYPAHLARIYILAHWRSSPALQSWYDVRSFLLPNVGMDLVVLGPAKFFRLAVAGGIFLAIILALILSGCMVVHRGVYGHFSLWPLVAALFLFNWIWQFGFLNYLLGVGLMLWATGLWVGGRRTPTWLRLLYGTVFAVVLFFCHLVALGLYAIIVAGYEVQRSASTMRTNAWLALRDLLVGAAIFLIPILLFLASPASGEISRLSYKNLGWKPHAVFRTLESGNVSLDFVTFAALAASLAVIYLYGRLRVAKSMSLPLALLLMAYLVTPYQLQSVQFVDARLPVAILFVTIGCLSLDLRSQVCRRALLVGFTGLLVCRASVLSYDWHQYDRVINACVTTFGRLAPQSLLFVVMEWPASGASSIRTGFARPLWRPPLMHVASWSTLQQPIFVATTFANLSQQPITVTSRYAALYNFQQHEPIPVKTADEFAAVTTQIRRLVGNSGLQPVPVFLLVLYPEFLQLPLPQGTAVVGAGPHFLVLGLIE